MREDLFPRYTAYDPKIPIWCVTPRRRGCLHRFFDTSPISPSGRYLAVFQMPFEDRAPKPGERGGIVLVDLETGEDRLVAETAGWEPQMGANINWGASDRELFFNDVDTATWRPFAWKLDPLGGERHRMEGTVYHASPDGRWLISANLATMRLTQTGYGVVVPDDRVRRNPGPVADDGFFLTDTSTGARRLLLSTRDAFAKADPPILEPAPERCEIYGFHGKFNPQGDRLMLSFRWYEPRGAPVFNAFGRRDIRVRFAWVTCRPDGGELHCAIGPEQWEKGGHHGTWFPDGRRISMNLNIDREGLRFVQADFDGRNLRKMLDRVTGSGHPTVSPDGCHLLTDAYAWEPVAYGDGAVPLRWISLADGTETALARIPTNPREARGVLRLDPHPAWDRTGRWVAFNGFADGTRRVFLADMAGLREC